MKQLRILTGFHAGAMVQLAPGQHRIHSGADADIRLTDWTGTLVTLEVDPSGVVCAVTREQAPVRVQSDLAVGEVAVEHETVMLVDFVPMRFGEMILCIGPDNVHWPSDLNLLSTLLTPSSDAHIDAKRQKRHRYYGALAACVALGIVVGTVALLVTAPNSEAALRHGADYRTSRIREALRAAHMNELQVRTVGNTSVVTGMVTNLSDDQLVQSTLTKIASKDIVRSYDVAQNMVHSIEDSLGIAGAHVKYLGNGDFAITGNVESNDAVGKSITRIRPDLDSNIRRLVVQTAENSGHTEQTDGRYSEILSSDAVQYTQTPDGIKHIYATESPTDSAEALSAPIASSAVLPSIDESTIARSTGRLPHLAIPASGS